jgi:hypothetical protein
MEGEWKWWGGTNQEVCTWGPCDTREQAIAEGIEDGCGEFQDETGKWKIGFHIVEARNDPLRLSDWIDTEAALERAGESVGDSDRASENDDGDYFGATREQQADLEKRIKAACDDWQTANGLVFETWTFSSSRNNEYVVVDAPDDRT